MRKIFSLFAALTLSVGLWAETVNVSYLYPVYNEGGATKGIKEWKTTTVDATVVETDPKPVTWGTDGQTTWFVVNGTDVTFNPPITCAGDVRLILADNAKLTARNSIIVTGTNSLTIYAQSTGTQMGQLEAEGGDAAGIGGGQNQSGNNITINGGQITATSSSGAGIGGGRMGSGSNITINGGQITATSHSGAGIGGGFKMKPTNDGDGLNITINGGTVIATSKQNAAGIGGGRMGSGSNITINGGTVEATGAIEGGAGIGGGNQGSASNITILAGTVTANGGTGAAGIGGGLQGSGSNITILAGTVTATGGNQGAGIGGGLQGSGSDITINGGEVAATGGIYGAGIGGGQNGYGSNITILAGTVTANGGNNAAGIGNGKDAQTDASNIFVATSLQVKADGNNPPTTVIENNGADLASSLAGKQYATITDPLPDAKTDAIAAVNAEIEETDNDNVKAIAENAVIAINAATTVAEVNALKTLAIAAIASAKAAYGDGEAAGYNTGYDEGEAAVRATLPTEGYDGPAVIITKGEKVLILFNPEKVEYKILEAD